jgi:hypothetical protein
MSQNYKIEIFYSREDKCFISEVPAFSGLMPIPPVDDYEGWDERNADKKNIFERLTEKGIRFRVEGTGDGFYTFQIIDLPDNGINSTWAEGEAYFEEMLQFAIDRESEG